MRRIKSKLKTTEVVGEFKGDQPLVYSYIITKDFQHFVLPLHAREETNKAILSFPYKQGRDF